MSEPGKLARCQKVIWPGARVVLGEIDGGGFGVWSIAGGEPIAIYRQDQDGWAAATQHWQAWERPAPPPAPASPDRGGLIAALVVVAVLVVLYVGFHAFRYRDCANDPGLFAWPTGCDKGHHSINDP